MGFKFQVPFQDCFLEAPVFGNGVLAGQGEESI